MITTRFITYKKILPYGSPDPGVAGKIFVKLVVAYHLTFLWESLIYFSNLRFWCLACEGGSVCCSVFCERGRFNVAWVVSCLTS